MIMLMVYHDHPWREGGQQLNKLLVQEFEVALAIRNQLDVSIRERLIEALIIRYHAHHPTLVGLHGISIERDRVRALHAIKQILDGGVEGSLEVVALIDQNL